LVAVPSIRRMAPRRAAPEADAARELYERYGRQIHAFCLQQLGNREEAEDATQSTFLNAFRGLKRGIDPEFESAWLHKIAHNVCLTRRRTSSRRRRVETPGDLDALQDFMPAHQAESEELIRLPEALDAMPGQQRRALLLREWQGLTYKEIAEELGVSQAAVETLLFRARRTLAAGLTEEPAKKRVSGRLRAGSDVGTVAAALKSLLVTGGAKVAVTAATVAATSIVVASPGTRHVVETAVVPPHAHRAAAPAPVVAAPVAHSRPVVAESHVSVQRRVVSTHRRTAAAVRSREPRERAQRASAQPSAFVPPVQKQVQQPVVAAPSARSRPVVAAPKREQASHGALRHDAVKQQRHVAAPAVTAAASVAEQAAAPQASPALEHANGNSAVVAGQPDRADKK
jgi:RNA polymerase sigma factor (sigma-70 family)